MSDASLAAQSSAVVETTHGKVRGARDGRIHVFKGLRYGAPPIGALRFAAPQPPQPWTGVADALDFGPQSPQPAGAAVYKSPAPKDAPKDPAAPRLPNILRTLRPLPPNETDEDCLFLNVWTPGLDDGVKRPVLVWCHGGGFTTGSGSWIWYDGTNMADRGDAVVVTLNHRLGAMGYLYLKELGGEAFGASGNAGMLDIVLALQWVKDNIAAFGGDPDKVTAFGQSGGGGKVVNLLGMPAAQGLFHRAIVQSGPILRGQDPQAATRTARALLEAVGVDPKNPAALRDLPWKTIADAQLNPAVARAAPLGGFAPVMDGHHLPAHPFDPAATPLSADVPMMTGYTAYETIFTHGMADRSAFALDEDGLHKRIGQLLGDNAGAAIALYRRLDPSLSPSDLYFRITTDQSFGEATGWLAERKAAQGRAPAYLYNFTWDSPVDDGAYRSAHNFEMPFVFANTGRTPAATPDSPEVRALSDQMCDAWVAFARTGDPNHPGLPQWPAFDAATRPTMIFDSPSRLERDPQGEIRAWWAATGAARTLGG